MDSRKGVVPLPTCYEMLHIFSALAEILARAKQSEICNLEHKESLWDGFTEANII
jgi:hypothetical protein